MSTKDKDWREVLADKREATSPSSGLFAPTDLLLSPDTTIFREEKSDQQAQPESGTLNQEDRKPSRWENYRVRAGEFIEEDEPILKMGREVFASRGNIQTVSGKPKSCKTFLTSAMAGACIAGEYLGMTTPHNNLKVLMFDTEQGRSRAQSVQRRIYRMCGFRCDNESEKLTTISVRELDPKERKEVLKESMEDTKPDLVILDGVRDLLTDFNSVTESSDLVNELMKLSVDYNCAIVTVIHQNKGDLNARGHLGSELMNKSETAMEVQRVNKISTVKPVYCRNMEFGAFSFQINDAALPELCDTPDDDKRENSIEALQKLITKAMFGSSQMKQTDLRDKLAAELNKSPKTATRRINTAIAQGILQIHPDDDKIVRLVIELDDDPEGDDLPF